MAFSYSGSEDISRGVAKVWTGGLVYSFKTTEECRIGVDHKPFIRVPSGSEFIILEDVDYIFDRDMTIMYSYPIVEDGVDPNVWYKESLSNITENTTNRREYDTTVIKVTADRTGTATIEIGASLWSQNISLLDTNWYVSRRTSSGETRLIDNHDFDLPANSGWNYMFYSVASVSITVTKDDLIAMSFIGDQYVQVGSETSKEHGQFMRITWD